MILDALQNPRITLNDAVIAAIIMIFALILHNVVQAYVAYRLGDSSARYAGFLNFEPQQHLEPWGLGLLLLLGFGWPKQIPTSNRNYKNRGKQELWVWLAGPLTYLLIAFVAILLATLASLLQQGGAVARSFVFAASVATLHAVINLFPVYPLDGARAALTTGNRGLRRFVEMVASYGFLGFFIFFLLMSYLGITGAIQSSFLRFFSNVADAIVRVFL